MARTYKESSIDFDQIEADLGELEPPRLTIEDLLNRVRPKLETMHRRGVKPDQMCQALRKHGIQIDARKLTNYLDTGSIDRPGKAVKAARPPQAAAPAPDPEASRQDILPISGPGPS